MWLSFHKLIAIYDEENMQCNCHKKGHFIKAYIYMPDMEATEPHYLLSLCLQSGGAWEECRQSRSIVEPNPIVGLP